MSTCYYFSYSPNQYNRTEQSFYSLKRQEKNASENVVCWSRLLQITA